DRQAARIPADRPSAGALRGAARQQGARAVTIFRALFFVVVFVPFLIIAIPLQWLIVKLKLPFWQAIPRAFHRIGCVFLGLRVTVIGSPATGRPTLLVSNHVS